MRIAGVRLPDGHALWLDAGQHELVPLDRVHGSTDGGQVEGIIFVTPDQLLQSPAEVDGTITDVMPRQHPDPDCDDLPSADLPPLGTKFEAEGVYGMVVGLDPVGRIVTVRQDDGNEGTLLHDSEDREVPL